jgi:hypothetical protein
MLLSRPTCRACGRRWKPRISAVASQEFCRACRKKRLDTVRRSLSLRPISLNDLEGPYLLPRALRQIKTS